MAFSRNAGFTSLIATDPAATAAGEVTPTRYNLAHTVTDAVSGGIPFFSSTTAEGTSALLAANALVIGGGVGAAPATLASLGTSGWVLTSAGAGSPPAFAALPAASVTLNGVTAATGAVTLASGNNTGIVWNWANTTNTTVAFRLGETTAATNGTSSSGVPNQVLFRLDTLATSTQSPLSVYSRAAHVFSVSPTTAQILATNGSAAAPTYAFDANPDAGMYAGSNILNFATEGTLRARLNISGLSVVSDGSGVAASMRWTSGASIDGFFHVASTAVGVAIGVENSRWTAGAYQCSYGTADAVSYAMNFRKARGTVASPTVITTGDDLATIGGFGYVGATGTYVEGCRITFDSTGVIANTTSGLGGIMRLSAAVVGTVGPVEIAQINGTEQHLLHVGTTPTITAGGGTGPAIAGTDEAFTITVGTGGIATSVEVTFAKAFTVAPRCSANHEGAILLARCVSTTTTVTIDCATPFTASGKITVLCRSGTT